MLPRGEMHESLDAACPRKWRRPSCLRPLPAAVARGLAAGAASAGEAAPAQSQVDHCLISLIDEAEVPAQEAGVLKEIDDERGPAGGQAGDLLAQIDDAKPRMEVEVAKAKLAVAKEKAADDINVRYAKASADVAKADYQVNAEANRKVPGSGPAEVLREKLMKYTEASLAIEKAKLEMRVAGHEAEVAKAEVDAAEENVRRHQIRSPRTAWSSRSIATPANGCSRATGAARRPHRPPVGRGFVAPPSTARRRSHDRAGAGHRHLAGGTGRGPFPARWSSSIPIDPGRRHVPRPRRSAKRQGERLLAPQPGMGPR